MNKKVLFLNGNSKTEFYNNERNKYENVNATSIFKANSQFNKMFRRLILMFRLPGLSMFFDSWKKHIGDYDLFVISVTRYSPYIGKYIRKRSNKKIIYWYWNPVITEIKPNKIENYDCEIFSFDQEDCEKYNMKYIHTYYFSSIKLPKNEIIYDLYFIGADKGRISQLLELKKIFEDEGLNVKFHITKSANSKKVENYIFQTKISYREVLEDISKAKAIFDLVQVGQTGMSQRPMEAIFHNKKLVTNDINICRCDFYNRNNIFILGKDNIDDLKIFLNSPYVAIDKEIVEKYDFGNWLNQIQNQINI